MWLNSSMGILKYIYIFFALLLLGCVDITPLTSDSSSDKMFVLCEMEASKKIIANIYYAGDVTGKKIRQVDNQDLLSFSLAEGDKDWGYAFEYHRRDSLFYIEPDKFEIKEGLFYRFLGIGQNVKGVDPKIQIPISVTPDTFLINEHKVSYDGGMANTILTGVLVLPKGISKSSFFYIVPRSESDLTWILTDFQNSNGQAFHKLAHKEGFLIDYAMLNTNEIKMNLSIKENEATSKIAFDFYNVTESFYRYNVYASNVFSGGSTITANPPIAGFNVQTDKAFGSFSALTKTSKTYIIK